MKGWSVRSSSRPSSMYCCQAGLSMESAFQSSWGLEKVWKETMSTFAAEMRVWMTWSISAEDMLELCVRVIS